MQHAEKFFLFYIFLGNQNNANPSLNERKEKNNRNCQVQFNISFAFLKRKSWGIFFSNLKLVFVLQRKEKKKNLFPDSF